MQYASGCQWIVSASGTFSWINLEADEESNNLGEIYRPRGICREAAGASCWDSHLQYLQISRMNENHDISILTRPRNSWHRPVLAGWAVVVMAAFMTLKTAPALAEQEYLLGPGDIIRINVFKNPDLSLDARVSEAGSISYPLVGSVPVSGLSLPGAERKISQMLKDGGFVLNPQVNILVTTGLSNLVSVIGEVKTAGRYSTEATGGHLSGMLAAAGGIAPTGGDVVVVTGKRDGKPFHREINIVDMSLSGNPSEDIDLYGGDTLFVNKAPMFYIYGQVQKPGQLPLVRGMTVIQALAAGGGITGKGTSRGIVRHRRDAKGKVKEESVSMDDDVQDQDVIYVKESLF